MNDLISRQAAIDLFPNDALEWDTYFGYIAPHLARQMIEELPSAQPVKHGKWIIRDNPGTGWYRITCSECGEDVTSNAPCIGFFPNAKVTWDYCPECGAKMDKECDNETD